MAKKAKRTMKAQVVIRTTDPKVPDFGLGKGVLGEQELNFTDELDQGFDSPEFAAALHYQEGDLMRQFVEVRWLQKTKSHKTK